LKGVVMIDLKEEWANYSSSWDGKKEYENFLKAFPCEKLASMSVVDYTSLKKESVNGESYFTQWLERGTATCGKFRTASSYTYGIYKVNPNNLPSGVETNKWKAGASSGYRTVDIKKKAKDEFIKDGEAEGYFNDKVRPVLIRVANYHEENLDVKPLGINYCRKIAYLYNPEKLIPIYKTEVIKAIADYFDVGNDVKYDSYQLTSVILDKIKKDFDLNITPENGFEVTQKLGAFLWDKFGKSFPLESKNMILHGAPGTGKTYAVENSIKQRLKLEVGDEVDKYYQLVQFHPSFGYEEFIDGVKPAGIDSNGQMQFKLVSGLFKKMCIGAAAELKLAVEEKRTPKNFYFIADEINRAELSRVFGEVLLCLEEDKRLSFKSKKWEGTKISTLNSELWGDDDAVIIENDHRYFGVPKNIYFIGTMNDIDRSVDSFDMALRRRFLWKHYRCDYDVIAEHYGNKDDVLEHYIDVCKNLNKHITGATGFDLGESFELGHSYFLKPKRLNKTQLSDTWINHLKPLLKEYLRSAVPVGEIEKHLKAAEKIYKLPTGS